MIVVVQAPMSLQHGSYDGMVVALVMMIMILVDAAFRDGHILSQCKAIVTILI